MDINQLHYDILHYQSPTKIHSTVNELCAANESLLETIKQSFSPLETRTRNRSRTALRAMKYSTYSKAMVTVPRGFTGSLNKYLTTLDEANDSLIKGYDDAMPKYTEALASLVESRTLPSYYVKPLHDISLEQADHTTTLAKYFTGDKEWARLGTVARTTEDLGLLYSNSESTRKILDDKWAIGLEQDVKVNTTYLRAINASMSRTSDSVYRNTIRKAGTAGYKMATLLELIAQRAWETAVVIKTVQNIREQTIRDIL